ncbi:hypothetical protein TUMSATVNIG1_26180 [Vibrio nigripulchritudo]|uniref:GNAT family N-acetyltransferase n=1 Tax=Vibrio nigripulchritudo TaxID=28173 RepID=UPI00190B448D|nr:GNAT family N-acetyltransferase [Vibrio nigripulchritudo]BCL70654.1 hypothetical protein VNTUMSATTG_25910 [Vibrio nigripulchritudo]BDU32009.1 hypothetical protein TUMSATVNIG1_26180 [Vibrio nigripulchritudo]
MIIRLAKLSDSANIHALSQYLGYLDEGISVAEQRLKALLSSSHDRVYVAQLNGRLVGWLHCFYAQRLASESFIEIGGMVVHPDVRGHGVGRALVEHATEVHKGKWRVRCHSEREDTHSFYLKLGFKINKTQCVFEKKNSSD